MQAAGNRSRRTRSILGAAVAHPLRSRCLTVLAERAASPTELAREFGRAVSNVSYHVRALKDLGLVEEVGTRPVRGTVEHYFRAMVLPCISAEEEAAMTTEERTVFARVITSVLAANADIAIEAGTFVERPDHHATRVPIRVDDQGWSEIAEAYMGLYERVDRIHAESAERLAGRPGDPGIPAVSFLAFFGMPERRAVRPR